MDVSSHFVKGEKFLSNYQHRVVCPVRKVTKGAFSGERTWRFLHGIVLFIGKPLDNKRVIKCTTTTVML